MEWQITREQLSCYLAVSYFLNFPHSLFLFTRDKIKLWLGARLKTLRRRHLTVSNAQHDMFCMLHAIGASTKCLLSQPLFGWRREAALMGR